MDKSLSDNNKEDKTQTQDAKSASQPAKETALSELGITPEPQKSVPNLGAYGPVSAPISDLSKKAWDKSAQSHACMSPPQGRLAIRTFPRAVMRAAFFTA